MWKDKISTSTWKEVAEQNKLLATSVFKIEHTYLAVMEMVGLLNLNTEQYFFFPGPQVVRSKAYCFQLVPWEVALTRYPVWEEFSTSVWDECQHSILINIGSYWFVAIIPIYKSNKELATRGADHIIPKLAGWSIGSVCGQVNMRPAVNQQALPLNRLLRPELWLFLLIFNRVNCKIFHNFHWKSH